MFQIGQLIRSGAAAAIDLGRHVYGRASQFVDALPIGNGMSAIDRAAHLAYNAANNFAAAHPTAARVAAAAAKAAIAAAAATEFARLFSSREVSSGEMYLMCSSMAAASIQELANIALENLSEITGTLSIIPAAMVMSQAAPSFSSLLLMQSVAKLAAKEGSGIAKAAFAAADRRRGNGGSLSRPRSTPRPRRSR